MEFEGFAGTLGLEWSIMLIFIGLTFASVEIVKGFGVKGKWLFAPGIVIPFILNLAWFSDFGDEAYVNWKLLILGTVLVSVATMGGNAKIKNWLHKWGRPSSKEPD